MESLHEGKGGEDEEMKQYNELLEKILDIQNPQRVKDRVQQKSVERKREVFTVEPRREDVVSMLEPAKDFREFLSQYKVDSMPPGMRTLITGNQFYSLDEAPVEILQQPAIAAVVHEDQVLVSGAVIKLRLLQDIMVAGVLVPKDHFVHGEVSLAGERLNVEINSIQYRQWVLPVALTVYDRKDGLPGIHVPGAITRDVVKKAASQSAQGLSNISMIDPSVGAQLAGSGLQAVQNLVGKAARLVRVTVTAGYPVLLKDKKQDDK
jgi:conjugative transposon TraM protein